MKKALFMIKYNNNKVRTIQQNRVQLVCPYFYKVMYVTVPQL